MHRCFMQKITALVVFLTVCGLVHSEVKVALGKQTVVMPEGRHGFRYFPDQSISVLNRTPLRFLMVSGDRTFLLEGPSFETARPFSVALKPSGIAGSFDCSYAGIGGAVFNPATKEILGFYHGEKPTGGKNKEGTTRFYASIGLAVSTNGGRSFRKIGPVITGRPEDLKYKGTAQGVGDASVCIDHTGQWLHIYYTEHSRRNPATGKGRSVITCMARANVKEGGRPGSWKKFYNGSFSEPGLGGKDSEVANCWAPHVQYIHTMKKYIMIGSRGCVGFYVSDDGVKWTDPTILFKMDDYPILNKEIAVHPTLFIEKATNREAVGHVLYGYSPKYGHTAPYNSHFLAKRPIRIELK